MNGNNLKLADLVNSYISLERQIQALIRQNFSHYCIKCPSKCCREEICRESIESAFLSMLTKRQGLGYDAEKGWAGPSGCRLAYGRPPVCYEFFCDPISATDVYRNSDIEKILRDFAAVGSRAHGNTHLVCLDNLEVLSPAKIGNMMSRIASVTRAMALRNSRRER